MGVWRRVDGSDRKPFAVQLYPLLTLPFFYYTYDWKVMCAFIVAWVSMLDGFDGDWQNFGYMSMRFTGFCGVSCALFGVDSWYIAAGLVSGLTYPICYKLGVNRFNELGEVVTGVLLTGVLIFVY